MGVLFPHDTWPSYQRPMKMTHRQLVYFPSDYSRDAVTCAMLAGVKRKRDQVEEEERNVNQREFILKTSKEKLQSVPNRRVEPSLRRSVLIINTLKHIEGQLRLEGEQMNTVVVNTSCLLPALGSSEMELDPPPKSDVTNTAACACRDEPHAYPTSAAHAYPSPPAQPPTSLQNNSSHDDNHLKNSPAETPVHDHHTPFVDPTSETVNSSHTPHRTSDSTVDTGPVAYCESVFSDTRFLLDSVLGGGCSERWTVGSFSALFDKDFSNVSSQGFVSPLPPSIHSSSHRGDNPAHDSPTNARSDGDILADLDMSVFDVDLLSLSPTMKLTQLSAEDLTQALPGTDSHNFATAPSCNPKNELLGDELDHIMQILVGI